MKVLSESLRVVLDPPSLEITRRGDPNSFVANTRDALERFPGMESLANGRVKRDLVQRVRSVFWYHTIELPGGITTEGIFDHRPLVPYYGLPADLKGKRALDIGTWDGFWAFELERRGAEVTAVDVEGLHQVDIPAVYRAALDEAGLKQSYGAGFEIAHNALSSRVDRKVVSVYDLDVASLGLFDFVHMGDLLLHLEYPTKALRKARSVCRDVALVVTPFDPDLEGDTVHYLGGWSNVVWWLPSLSAAGQMIVDAGFSSVELVGVYGLAAPWESTASWRATFRARA